MDVGLMSNRMLQVTGRSKKTFLLNNFVPLNAQVSGYLDLEFYNLSPF